MGENMKDPGIKKLPTNLSESLDEFEKDENYKKSTCKRCCRTFH